MEAIIQALNEIESIPGSFVDHNFGQGFDVVLEHYHEGHDVISDSIRQSVPDYSDNYQVDKKTVENFFNQSRDLLEDYKIELKPYSLPSDYLFFLEYSGGLQILKEDNFYLDVHGNGPWSFHLYSNIFLDSKEWAEGIDRDFQHRGIINIGTLVNHSKNQIVPNYVSFFQDLGGSIKKNSVLGITEYLKKANPVFADIFANFSNYPEHAKVVANSFTEWLELIAQTRGALGYL